MGKPRGKDSVRERNWTDLGNAEMFAEVYRNDARYNHRDKHWLVWRDERWKADTDSHIIAMAKVIPQIRYRHASEIENDDERKKAVEFARNCESLYRIKALLELAETETPLSDDGTAWDRDPLLLGVANGVVDLRTMELLKDRREDRITLHTCEPFDEKAECPRWDQFLREVFNRDDELIGYMQRAVGYTLTGSVKEQCFHILFGEGQNGKSLFLRIVQHILGPYSYSLPFSAFEKTARSSISCDLAATAGKRLVTAIEVDERMALNEARLKAMTGGDTQAARFLYKNTFNFDPTAKVWLAVNRKPTVTDDTHALWRRVRLVPFLQKFDGVTQDKELEEKLKREASGILFWAVVGCLDWQCRGLGQIPQAICDATRSYRDESDIIGQFLTDCCELEPGVCVPVADLWTEFKAWCIASGNREIGNRQFNERLEARGMRRKQRGEQRTRFWFGLSLRDNPSRRTT